MCSTSLGLPSIALQAAACTKLVLPTHPCNYNHKHPGFLRYVPSLLQLPLTSTSARSSSSLAVFS